MPDSRRSRPSRRQRRRDEERDSRDHSRADAGLFEQAMIAGVKPFGDVPRIGTNIVAPTDPRHVLGPSAAIVKTLRPTAPEATIWANRGAGLIHYAQ